MTGLHPVCQRFESVIEYYRDLVQLVELQSPKLSVGSSNLSVPANKLLWVGDDDGGVVTVCKTVPLG